MKDNCEIFKTIVSASTAAVPRKVAMMVRNSKAHHSLQSITVPGRPREMNSYHCPHRIRREGGSKEEEDRWVGGHGKKEGRIVILHMK